MALKNELKTLTVIEDDKLSRVESRSKPTVVFNTSKVADIFLPGTVTVVMAKKGSTDLKNLQKAIQTNDTVSLGNLTSKIVMGFKDRKEVSLDEAATILKAQASFVELRYSGKTLIDYLNLYNNLPFAVATFPYAGGNIDPSLFEQIDYARTAGNSIYESLVVVHEPNLSVDEKALMQKLSVGTRDASVGFCPAACGVAAAVVVAVVVVAVAIYSVVTAATSKVLSKSFDSLNSVHLTSKQLNDLGAVNSARELVRLRREIILKS